MSFTERLRRADEIGHRRALRIMRECVAIDALLGVLPADAMPHEPRGLGDADLDELTAPDDRELATSEALGLPCFEDDFCETDSERKGC